MKLSFFKVFTVILLIFVFPTSCSDNTSANKTTSPEQLTALISLNMHSNPELAKKYAQMLLEKSERESDIVGVYQAYIALAKTANIEGKYTKAIDFCDKAIQIAKTLKNDTFLAEAYILKGNAIVYLGNNKDALDSYLDALAIAKKIKELDLEIRASGNIAKIKRRIGHHEEALQIYKRNLNIALDSDFQNKTMVITLFMGVGGSYLRLQQPDSTIHYSNLGLERSKKANDIEADSYFYNDIGMAYYQKEDYPEAIDHLKKAEKTILDLNNKSRLTETYFYIGRAYDQLGKYDLAIDYLKKVESIVSEQNNTSETTFNPPELIKTYELLSQALKKQGKHSESLDYAQKYIVLDKHNDQDKDKVSKDLYQNQKQEKEVLTIANSQQKNKVTYLIVFLSGLLIVFLFFLRKFFAIKKQNKEIFQKLIDSVEKEKNAKKSISLTIEDEKVTVILENLKKLEDKLYFLNSNCTLQNMAKKIKTNTTYLSKVLKDHKQKSFYEYLNELRIQYALHKLKEDSKFRNYSIKHIAEEIGYKSANSFTKHFKAHTKLYPSYYIKNLNENQANTTSN